MAGGEPEGLTEIRKRIDSIDEAIHRLLIERSAVIDALIRLKGASGPAGAFRPGREAEMMRRLVLRHDGRLPVTAVEHIWREIITTFTSMQAPFGIVAAPAADPDLMRDLVRFYFGFTVKVTRAASVAEALARAGGPGREIAVVAADSDGRWWAPLLDDGAPKIFAKLPFIEAAGRPAALPAYVVGPALGDGAAEDVKLVAVSAAGDADGAVRALGGRVVRRSADDLLVELPQEAGEADFARAARARGARISRAAHLGGFPAPIRLVGAEDALGEPITGGEA